MTGRILIVDDVDINRRLLEAKLHAEYFEVLTASRGPEALAICAAESIDIVLLDVMMPDMDGYEVCRRLKADHRTRHLPVILVTALDLPSDRVRGLEAGADDFLTKPVRELQLLSRVKSLLRLKLLSDELRIRADTTASILGGADLLMEIGQGGRQGRVVVVEEEPGFADRSARILAGEHDCWTASPEAAARGSASADLVIVDLAASRFDPLRFCSQLRSNDATRRVPILLLAALEDEQRIAKALELGVNDYLLRPIDRNELLARARTQIKRKRYDEGLRRSLQSTVELAVTDPLTGLQNRRFLESHLPGVIDRARSEDRPLSVLIADIDHFKQINDRRGHDVGDEVLREFARRVRDGSRASDLCCRLGGEEFVVVMPDTAGADAAQIAERMRSLVADAPFRAGAEFVPVTVSVGIAEFDPRRDDVATLLKRADRSLYAAKHGGRNRVAQLAA